MEKVPQLTEETPYIKFTFDKNGKMTLSAHHRATWGGINSGFWSTDGTHGNVCDKPEQLDRYISVYVQKIIKQKEKEVLAHQKELDNLRSKLNQHIK